MEELLSGKYTFDVQVPYTLYESDNNNKKPLIIYLHGFGQNITLFKEQVTTLLQLQAYHLFVQGPYPLYDRNRSKPVDEWGRAWYLYDGRPQQFADSLEQTSYFLQQLLEALTPNIQPTRKAIVGYSMGGYLAGYYGLSRVDDINDLAVMGSRIKTELFEERHTGFEQLNVLALHGRYDQSVKSGPQKKSCATLERWGASVMFKELEETHKLSSVYLRETKKWFRSLGYQ